MALRVFPESGDNTASGRPQARCPGPAPGPVSQGCSSPASAASPASLATPVSPASPAEWDTWRHQGRPSGGNEAQVRQSLQEREDGWAGRRSRRGGAGSGCRTRPRAPRPPSWRGVWALSKGLVHSDLGNVLHSSGAIPEMTPGTTTLGVTPQVPGPLSMPCLSPRRPSELVLSHL